MPPGAFSKSATTIVLGGQDFTATASNFHNLTTFRATFSYIFTAICAYAETAIYEHPVKILTSAFGSLIPISLYGFLFIFELDQLNVRHISAPGVVDLLT